MGRKDCCKHADRTFLVWEGAILITIRHNRGSGKCTGWRTGEKEWFYHFFDLGLWFRNSPAKFRGVAASWPPNLTPMLQGQFFMQNQNIQLKTGKSLHLHTANLDPWLVVKYMTTVPLYCSLCNLMVRKDCCEPADRTFLVWEGAILITIRHNRGSGKCTGWRTGEKEWFYHFFDLGLWFRNSPAKFRGVAASWPPNLTPMLQGQFFMQNQNIQLKTGKSLHLHTANLDPWLVVKYMTTVPLYCSLCNLMVRKDCCEPADRTFLVWEGHSQTQQGVRNVSLALCAPNIFGLGIFGTQDDRMGPSSIKQKCSGWSSGPWMCNSHHQGMKTGSSKLCLEYFFIFCHFDPKI